MGFGGHFAQQQTRDYECPLWVISGVLGALADVRFTPESDRLLQRREMTLCAISDQSAPQQNRTLFDELVGYGKHGARAFAVLRLITSSNLVG
jgi:hypothetical protein